MKKGIKHRILCHYMAPYHIIQQQTKTIIQHHIKIIIAQNDIGQGIVVRSNNNESGIYFYNDTLIGEGFLDRSMNHFTLRVLMSSFYMEPVMWRLLDIVH